MSRKHENASPRHAKGEDTRKKLVEAALGSFQAQGYRGTGLSRLLSESGFPRGSLYFHFPDGKEQLGVAAMLLARGEIGTGIDTAFEVAKNPTEALRLIADGFAAELEASGFARGCPVTTVALEAGDDTPGLRAACAQTYDDWIERLTAHLKAAGMGPARARRLATFALSAIEGALILSRSRRSTVPLYEAVDELSLLLK